MKTVKVKIAVAVGPSGDWSASGWLNHNGEIAGVEAMDIASEGVSKCDAKYWIEAELPIPETKTIQGTASKVES